jgi:RND family efflux transporter MFP subunit
MNTPSPARLGAFTAALMCATAACAAPAAPSVNTTASCLVEPASRLTLRASVNATITALHVDRGSLVRRGQLLVSLNSGAEQALLASARLRMNSDASVQAAQARLDQTRERLRRRAELIRENFISGQDHDDAAADHRVAETALTEALHNRDLARLDAQRLSAELQRYSISSPINGVVTERLLAVGELASTGDGATAVLKLAQTDPLRIELVLPLSQAGRVKVGSLLTIRPEIPVGASFRALVKVVDPVVDAGSGTFGVRLEVANPNGALLAGVKCSAEL